MAEPDEARPVAGPPVRVTVWNENVHERTEAAVRDVYPEGIHSAVAEGLRAHLGDAQIRTATFHQPDHGLPESALRETDVLLWWGHLLHDEVDDQIAERVHHRVLEGMGLVVLHSGHLSKPFRRLMGTRCSLRWREADDREVVWTVSPSHPVADNVPIPFVIPRQEMYGEYFDIPTPDELVFISSFSGGEVFRSGCCFNRGKGRIFYFSPGHETYPIYFQPEVRQVIANAVRWVHQPQPSVLDTSDCLESPTGWYGG
jgi:trehalose utilization protein